MLLKTLHSLAEATCFQNCVRNKWGKDAILILSEFKCSLLKMNFLTAFLTL